MPKFKLGFIINPIAGIGGSVALKGSDDMAEQALLLGAQPKANVRAKTALEVLLPYKDQITIYTASGLMGEQCAKSLGFDVEVICHTQPINTQSVNTQSVNGQTPNEKVSSNSPDILTDVTQTKAQDTQNTVLALLEEKVDVILFAGGDGTARNIADTFVMKQAQDVEQVQVRQIPVLGIPAGCKIHSGVYAITPKSAGLVIELMITKQLVTLTTGDVMDINESLFREGIVKAKRYGEMQIPSELRYVQAVKSGGKEHDDLVLQDIAASVIDQMYDEEDTLFVMGSGSTTAFLMSELNLEHTLLGVDLVYKQGVITNDVTEKMLFQAVHKQIEKTEQVKLVVTLIGGQGHIFGRGNQQLSPRIIKAIIGQPGGKDNIIIIATKTKLTALNQRALICDTGDSELDQQLAGFMSITTGYNDQVLYAVSSGQ